MTQWENNIHNDLVGLYGVNNTCSKSIILLLIYFTFLRFNVFLFYQGFS